MNITYFSLNPHNNPISKGLKMRKLRPEGQQCDQSHIPTVAKEESEHSLPVLKLSHWTAPTHKCTKSQRIRELSHWITKLRARDYKLHHFIMPELSCVHQSCQSLAQSLSGIFYFILEWVQCLFHRPHECSELMFVLISLKLLNSNMLNWSPYKHVCYKVDTLLMDKSWQFWLVWVFPILNNDKSFTQSTVSNNLRLGQITSLPSTYKLNYLR